MKVNDFCNMVKRASRYGSTGTTADQPATDILNSINLRRKRIWAKWNWPWALTALSETLVAGTTEYTLTTKVDRITDLYIVDNSVSPNEIEGPLKQCTRQDFLRWVATGTQTNGIPDKYINLGLASTGYWQVKINPPPQASLLLKGWGKKILATYTSADLVANTDFDYFPDGIIEDVLWDGVLSDACRIQGETDEAARLDMSFEHKLKLLVQEQAGAATDDTAIASPVPDGYRWKKQQRSKYGTGNY